MVNPSATIFPIIKIFVDQDQFQAYCVPKTFL